MLELTGKDIGYPVKREFQIKQFWVWLSPMRCLEYTYVKKYSSLIRNSGVTRCSVFPLATPRKRGQKVWCSLLWAAWGSFWKRGSLGSCLGTLQAGQGWSHNDLHCYSAGRGGERQRSVTCESPDLYRGPDGPWMYGLLVPSGTSSAPGLESSVPSPPFPGEAAVWEQSAGPS